jgi:hypothetical protein
MSGVMRGDAALQKNLAMLVRFDFGKLQKKVLINLLSPLLFRRVGFLRFVGSDFERGFVAASARRQKDNRGQKIVIAKCRDKFRRRNFGQFKFQMFFLLLLISIANQRHIIL